MDNTIRRERKHEIAEKMIITYCKGNHDGQAETGLCAQCKDLCEYSKFRTSKCPHIEKTLFCVNCPTPCYKPDMKEAMRVMMKYSGPRFFLRHPIIVLDHVFYDFKTRRKK